MNFKNYIKVSSLTLAAVLACGSFALTSCSDDDKDQGIEAPVTGPSEEASYAENYFSLENGSFVSEAIPTDGVGEAIQGLSTNSQALTGGMNFITINTDQEFTAFLVGVKDQPGYWTVDAEQVAGGRSQNSYVIPVNFGTEFDSDFTMVVVAKGLDGKLSQPTEAPVSHVESKSGDLNINLTFSNEKDIDLHLYTPSGQHIYYGNRGGVASVELPDGTVVDTEYGLDHDSNAACSIDGLNNENIFIPAELIEPGVYRIEVDMWSNCDPTISTNWAIVARYQDAVLVPTTGSNPASGVYPVNAGSGDHTEVMTFTLVEGEQAAPALRRTVRPLPMTESVLNKLAQLPEATLKAYGLSDLFE